VAIRTLNAGRSGDGHIFGLNEVKTMKELENLSVKERAGVIGGLVMVGVWIVTFLVFIFVVSNYFHISDRLKSGSSLFSVMPLIMLLLYVLTLLPMICVGVTVAGIFAKLSYSSVLKGVLVILLLVGVGLLLPASVFALFALTLSNISIYVQVPLTILTILVCGMAMTYMTKARKIDVYLKKILD
jgi:hypothetical protein